MTSEDRRRHIEQQVINQVTILTDEILVLFLFDEDEQVPVDATSRSCVTLTGHGKLHTSGYAGRDGDRDDLVVTDDTFATAFRAFVFDDASFAVTGVALCLHLHHTEYASLLPDDASGTLTGRTGLGGAVFAARAVAVLTLNEFAHFDFFLAAFGYLFERQTHFDAHVGTSANARTATSAASSAHEHFADVAQVETCAFEDVAEMREDIFHGHSASAEAAGALHSGMTELVIPLSFLRVGQHLVCFSCFLEFLFSFLVARVLVRVVLYRFLAVRFFYFFRAGGLFYAKHFIVISFLCHKVILPLLLWRNG